jgi:hypothetical protein
MDKMAYIKTEEVREIRTQLKKEFPGLKFSVTRLHYSKVKIVIKSGDVDFFSDYNVDKRDVIGDYIVVNGHYIDNNFTGVSKDILKRINEIAYSQGYYDNSDAMTDYFDTAYYVDIKIGDWDIPYQLKQKRAA